MEKNTERGKGNTRNYVKEKRGKGRKEWKTDRERRDRGKGVENNKEAKKRENKWENKDGKIQKTLCEDNGRSRRKVIKEEKEKREEGMKRELQ